MINKLHLYISIIAIAVISTSCSIDGTRLAYFNNPVSKDVVISDFSAIRLSGYMSITYTTGVPALKIEAPEHVIDDITVKITDGKLDISIPGSYSKKMNFTGDKEIKIYVSSQKINSAEINGTGDIIFDTPIINNNVSFAINGAGYIVANQDIICTSTLKCSINGAGDIKVKGVKANDVYANINSYGSIKILNINSNGVSSSINGTGKITLEGKTKTAILEVPKIGKIDADKLSSQRTIATVNGLGSIDCNASEELITSITGNGDISYTGNPKIIVDKSNDKKIKLY